MVDQVGGVLLQRVVDAGFEVGLRAVVVDAQPAAHVEVAQPRPGAAQFHVHAGRLGHGALDLADVGDLAAQVEVQQLEAILHAERLQLFQRAQRLDRRQPELRPVAARRPPAARTPAGQFEPHAQRRPHAHPPGMLENHVQFGELFDHRNDLPADLLCQLDHLDVLGVLEPVAQDGRLVVGNGQHRQQFGLRSGLQTEAIRPAELEDLRDHLPLLVDLDRVRAAIAALVAVLGDGVLERLVNLLQAVFQDLSEADQDGQRDAAQHQVVDQFLQVDGPFRLLGRVDQQVAPLAHREVGLSPPRDVIKFGCVGHGPAVGGLAHQCFFRKPRVQLISSDFKCRPKRRVGQGAAAAFFSPRAKPVDAAGGRAGYPNLRPSGSRAALRRRSARRTRRSSRPK